MKKEGGGRSTHDGDCVAIIQLDDWDAVGGGHGEQGCVGGALEILARASQHLGEHRAGDQRVSSAHTNLETGARPCLLYRISVPFNLVL